jgi:SPP1 gp7 family putative phage head morphogenesis protein
MATSTAIGLITRGMAYGTRNKAIHLQQFRVQPLKKAAYIEEGDRDETVDQLMWNATMDNNTCEPCAELDGEFFSLDDAPTPSEICLGGDNCRCTLDVEPATSMIIYSDEEDELAV